MNCSGLLVPLKKALNPQSALSVKRYGSRFAIRDKVIQSGNSYEKDVFNGDIGMIRNADGIEQVMSLDFDGKSVEYDFDELDELSLAYACTIHKSQGSEYSAVIVVLHTQHYQMLKRNLVYTGMTRGKKLVVMVGSRKALWIALKQSESGKRYSRLKERLSG